MMAAVLTPAIGWLAIVSLTVTQGIKAALLYTYRSPPAEMIWFVIGPLGTAPFAWIMWNTAGVHWLAAAAAASLLANLFYAYVLKRLVGWLNPTGYERLNAPINRRHKHKRHHGPERRQR